MSVAEVCPFVCKVACMSGQHSQTCQVCAFGTSFSLCVYHWDGAIGRLFPYCFWFGVVSVSSL